MSPPDVRWQPSWVSDDALTHKSAALIPQRPNAMFGRFSASLVVTLLIACTVVSLYDLVLLAGHH
ncbi:MAG: hypothetical protein QOF12_688 [Solirubrobacteraceae bacterium]|jgi:hypothetical protein|nr:hypothetical protein [Solirubrobacteraceae bacterium]